MKRIAISAAALVVALIAIIFIYFNFIRDEAPEAFDLTEAGQETNEDDDAGSDDASAEDTATDSESADNGTTDDGTPDPADMTTLDGTWSAAAGSEAGYRVVEDLGSIQDFEAVGRTTQVSGSVEIAGTSILGGSFDVDVASISSDDERRDGHFTADIMNATTFPTATITLTGPIELGSIPAVETPIDATAVGELTLRDVTNPVTIPVKAQILGEQIEIVASIDVLFSDFGIANPSNPFVSVRDEGKVEVRILLAR